MLVRHGECKVTWVGLRISFSTLAMSFIPPDPSRSGGVGSRKFHEIRIRRLLRTDSLELSLCSVDLSCCSALLGVIRVGANAIGSVDSAQVSVGAKCRCLLMVCEDAALRGVPLRTHDSCTDLFSQKSPRLAGADASEVLALILWTVRASPASARARLRLDS